MAIFDNVRDRLTQAGQSTVQKAKGLSEVAKLTAQISNLENQVNDMYRQIGYAIYCAHHEDPLPEVAGAINAITEMHNNIENCRAQIKAINAADTCPQCGAKVNKGMVFCGSCGYRLVAEQQPVAAQPQPGVEQPFAAEQQPTVIGQQPFAVEQQPAVEQPFVAEQQPTTAGQTTFCSNCGTPCPPGSAFCPSCGQAVKTNG